MSDSVSPAVVADLIGATAPTVRRMVERGELESTKEIHGSRGWTRINLRSVEAYLAEHGRFDERPCRPTVAALQQDLEELRQVLTGNVDAVSVEKERDDLRAENVSLSEALVQMRTAFELQRNADVARTQSISHLREAIEASDRANNFLLEAVDTLSKATSGLTFPGHAGSLRSA